jgi:hypothetical protein
VLLGILVLIKALVLGASQQHSHQRPTSAMYAQKLLKQLILAAACPSGVHTLLLHVHPAYQAAVLPVSLCVLRALGRSAGNRALVAVHADVDA